MFWAIMVLFDVECLEQVSTDVVVKDQSFSLSQFLGPIQLTEEERTSPENRSASEVSVIVCVEQA